MDTFRRLIILGGLSLAAALALVVVALGGRSTAAFARSAAADAHGFVTAAAVSPSDAAGDGGSSSIWIVLVTGIASLAIGLVAGRRRRTATRGAGGSAS